MNTKYILLVEDAPDEVKLMSHALRASHVINDLVVASNGREALDILFHEGKCADTKICDPPTLVLLDLVLPDISGFEVLNRIRSDERTKLLPVIILTSLKEQEDIVRGYTLGANSYVRKPVNFDQFVESVRQLGLYWLVVNEPPPKSGKWDEP